jgi:folate-dependent phosphoribosylglycinamide formyltransferase PurN
MKPKIALITGPGLNHRYFINRLNRKFPIECVFIEELTYPRFDAESPKHQEAWEWFFQRRRNYEEATFADSESWIPKNQPTIIPIAKGQLNSIDSLTILKNQQPDIIIIFGSSLVGQEIMGHFPNRIINLHVGISGQYRGSSSNFWPIHDGRLDCLGATLLKINTGIDTGEILAQETIQIEENDTEQSLMGKSLILGMDLTIQVLRRWLNGKVVTLPLERNGKLFQKKDFTPDAISKVKEMVESGQLASLIKTHLNLKGKAI